MNLANMTDYEFELYKRETLKRLSNIAEAEGHSYTVIVSKYKMTIMYDHDNDKSIFELTEGSE